MPLCPSFLKAVKPPFGHINREALALHPIASVLRLSRQAMVTQVAGFSLIETLIMTAIVGGLFVSLFLTELGGLSDVRSAASTFKASTLAKSMGERIKANASIAASTPASYAATLAPTGTPCETNCTPEQVRDRDLTLWFDQVKHLASTGALPEATAKITYAEPNILGVPFAQYDIEIQWKDYDSQNKSAQNGYFSNRVHKLSVSMARQ